MKIAVDLDGVCYEFEKTARYMLREYRGCTGLETESTHWDWISERVSDVDWEWLWNDGVALGLFRFGHCVRGSINGLRQLRDAGHSLLAVTHRPSRAVPDTLAWLAYNGIPWSEVHILSDGQSKSTIKADILIDDKPENVDDWVNGVKALLFDRSWNQEYSDNTWVKRVFGWKGVIDAVRSEGAGRDRGIVLEDAQASYERWRNKAQSWDKGVLEG